MKTQLSSNHGCSSMKVESRGPSSAVPRFSQKYEKIHTYYLKLLGY